MSKDELKRIITEQQEQIAKILELKDEEIKKLGILFAEQQQKHRDQFIEFAKKIYGDKILNPKYEIGKIVWLESKVFSCQCCKLRYDFAIRYNDDLVNYYCRVCNSKVIISDASLRLGLKYPRDQKALNQLIRKKIKGYGDEKDWL